MLTCAHVCSTSPVADGQTPPLDPSQAELAFPALNLKRRVAEVLWWSPVAELDACLVALDDAVPGALPVHASGEVHPQETDVYLMGFPSGGKLHFSFNRSEVQHVGRGFFSYLLAAEPGISGGPVFSWDGLGLAGIHRGARSESRQGVLLEAIRYKIAGG